MEPENHWVVEENSLQKINFQVPCGSFPGCYLIKLGSSVFSLKPTLLVPLFAQNFPFAQAKFRGKDSNCQPPDQKVQRM